MLGRELEIIVGTQQGQIVLDAELGKYCINGANLDPRSSARVSKFHRGDMIFSIGLQNR